MASINRSDYRGTESLIIENDYLAVTVLPFGGRIVSILDKSINKEFLMQQEGVKYNQREYDSDYDEADPAGFDDMFPTIVKSFYPDYPWEGILLPDHGEVWSLPWDYNIKSDAVKMSVNGIRLPYRLEKEISITDKKKLRIDYKAINVSNFDMKFIWTAHPMLIAEEGLEFELPAECDRAVSVENGSQRTGEYGNIFNWRDHAKKGINTFRDPGKRNIEKYYFLDRVKSGFIRIRYPSTGSRLSLDFPAEKVPYIGIYIDEGGWKKDIMYMIPEPCTAPMDRIDISDLYGKSSIINKHSAIEWYLIINID